MANAIVNYQCPSCTGPLHFASESGKLECEYCGSSYDVAQIEAMYAAKEEAAVQTTERKQAKSAAAGDQWDVSGLTDDWGGEEKGMKAYSCPSCGAELICDETTAATSCPYCGNPTVVPGQFSGMLKPDYVIPFRVSKENAIEALKKHYSGKPFLPSAFTSQQQMEKIQGVYVPFWLFDGEASGSCTFSAELIEEYEDRDERVTKTDYYKLFRQGNMKFEKIPVDASTKMPDGHMDAIEPFDYAQMKPFSTAYLPGYLADKYDLTVEDSSARADGRCEKTFEDAMRSTASMFTISTLDHKNVQISRGEVHYALLPVWMVSVKWNKKNFLFAVNGQTGKTVGDLPVSWGKFFKKLAMYTVGLGGIAHLLCTLIYW